MGTDNTVLEPTAVPPPVLFSAGLPPAPKSLVKHIQEGRFVDMSELTVDCLTMLSDDESSKLHNPRRRLVTSVIEWAQCFLHYSAIVSLASLERTLDLLGYQYLMLETHLEYGWYCI